MLAREMFAVFISAIQYVIVWKEFMQFVSIIVIFSCKTFCFGKSISFFNYVQQFFFWYLQPQRKEAFFKGSIEKNALVLQKSVLQCSRVMNPKNKFSKTFHKQFLSVRPVSREHFKDTHREKAPYTPALTKNTNMDIWAVVSSN